MAAEKQVQLDVELLDVLEGACDQQDYRSISPFGKCPCLGEGEFLTSGAPAILAYLDVRGQGGLMNPKKAAIYGEQNYWCQLAESLADPAVSKLMQELVCGPMCESAYVADDNAVAVSRAQLAEVLDAMDTQLGSKSYIVGEYSYADIYWTAIVHLCMLLGEQELIDSRPQVKLWFDRVQARNSFSSLPSLDDIKHKQLRSVA